jgi:hypothetical protein
MVNSLPVFTVNELLRIIDTHEDFKGFSGEICGSCEKLANVIAFEPGWLCKCGRYNSQSSTDSYIPYQKPDFGTPRNIIVKAYSKSKRWNKIMESCGNDE